MTSPKWTDVGDTEIAGVCAVALAFTATVTPAGLDAFPTITTTGRLPVGALAGTVASIWKTPATKPGASPAGDGRVHSADGHRERRDRSRVRRHGQLAILAGRIGLPFARAEKLTRWIHRGWVRG